MRGLGTTLSPQQLASVNNAIATKVDGSVTLDQLLNLPTLSRNTLPKLPDGSYDWRWLPGVGDQFQLTDKGWVWNVTMPAQAQSAADWLKANQTWVLIGAGTIVLLALMRGRR